MTTSSTPRGTKPPIRDDTGWSPVAGRHQHLEGYYEDRHFIKKPAEIHATYECNSTSCKHIPRSIYKCNAHGILTCDKCLGKDTKACDRCPRSDQYCYGKDLTNKLKQEKAMCDKCREKMAIHCLYTKHHCSTNEGGDEIPPDLTTAMSQASIENPEDINPEDIILELQEKIRELQEKIRKLEEENSRFKEENVNLTNKLDAGRRALQ